MRGATARLEGRLRSFRREVALDLVADLELQIGGEILAELLSLARAALAEGGDAGHTNVAAVLAAAAFEDAIRRLGERAGVEGRPKLSEVVAALKDAEVLAGADLRLAQNNHLTLRNDALHADWEKLGRPSVESLIAYVESLLAKHFGQDQRASSSRAVALSCIPGDTCV